MRINLVALATAAAIAAGGIASAPAMAEGHDGWHHRTGYGEHRGWNHGYRGGYHREWRGHRWERQREWRHHRHEGYRGYHRW